MGLVAKIDHARNARSTADQAAAQGATTGSALAGPSSYWASTRRPFPSLLLVAPLVIAYESGVLWLGSVTPGGVRTGADTWMRQALSSLGLSDHWLLPLLLVLILLIWQVVSFYNWRFSPGILAGMVLESMVWAVVLLGISRLIDFGFSYLEQTGLPLLAIDAGGGRAVHRFLDRLPGRRGLRGDAVSPDPGPHLLRDPAALADAAGSGELAGRDGLGTCSSRWPTTPAARARRSPGLRSSSAGWPASFSPGSSCFGVSGSPSARIRCTTSWSAGSPGGCDGRSGRYRLAPSRRRPLRIVHLSDIHFWQYAINPAAAPEQASSSGMTVARPGTRGRFRLERVPDLVERVQQPGRRPYPDHRRPDHDGAARRVSCRPAAPWPDWLADPARVTIIPGNHDRYTLYAHRSRRFERYFGDFSPETTFPWLRDIGDDTAILGLDPTRSGITASGRLTRSQLMAAPRATEGGQTDRQALDRLPLPGRGPRRVGARLCAQATPRASPASGVVARRRLPYLLLRTYPYSVGLPAPHGRQPAFPERGRAAALRPVRPPSPRLPRDHARGFVRARRSPCVDRRRLASPPLL